MLNLKMPTWNASTRLRSSGLYNPYLPITSFPQRVPSGRRGKILPPAYNGPNKKIKKNRIQVSLLNNPYLL